ncbi:MAG: beta strand repeat-containing protein, partial [Desulfocucumaceae bacterium]
CDWESDDSEIISVKSGKLKALQLTGGTVVSASCNLPGSAVTTQSLTVKVISPIKSLAAEPFSLLGIPGGSAQLALKPINTDGSTGGDIASEAQFSSSNVKVATVTSLGLVNFLTAGTATISTAYAGKNVKIPVKVSGTPLALVMYPNLTNIQMAAGSTTSIRFKNGSTYLTAYVALSSDAPTVVSTKPGMITALSPGTAIITYSYGGTSNTFTVDVVKKIASLSAVPSSVNMAVGDNVPLVLTATYTDKSTGLATATYTSDNTGIATVDSNTGLVTGIAPGSTRITATVAGKSITVPVTVIDSSFSAITFTAGTIQWPIVPGDITYNIASGNSLKVSAQALFGGGPYNQVDVKDITSQCVFTSDDTTVATISSSGLVTAKKAGAARISASFGTKSNSFLVNVWPAISSLTATPDTLAFFGSLDGPKDILTAEAKFSDGSLRDLLPGELEWTSKDASLVTVNGNGRVTLATPFKTGSTTVTGSFAGKTVVVGVSVKPQINSISASTANLSLITGTPATFSVLGYYSGNTYGDVTRDCQYSVSDMVYRDKISVDKYKGTITALTGASGSGTVDIRLLALPVQQISYTVIPKPEAMGLELVPSQGVAFNQNNVITNNGTFYFNLVNQSIHNLFVHTLAAPTDNTSRISGGNMLSVFSSNNSVAKISSSGGVYTLEKGSAITGSAVITVYFLDKTFKFTVSIDTTPPAAPLEVLATQKDGTTQSANFSIIVTAETGSSVTAKKGATIVLQSASPVTAVTGKATLPIDITKLAEGSNSIDITVTDPAGNPNPLPTLTVNVTKDTTSPAITISAASVNNGGDTIAVQFGEDPRNDTGQVINLANWTLQYADDVSGTGLTAISVTNAVNNYNSLTKTLTITLNEATDQVFIPDNKFVRVTPHSTNISDLYGNAGIAAAYTGAKVVAETNGPTISAAWTKTDPTHFTITYSDVLKRSAATNTANWTLTSVNTISGVALSADGKTVTVTLSGNISSGDTLQPTANVTDLAGNPVIVSQYIEP